MTRRSEVRRYRDAATYDLCKVSAREAGEKAWFGDHVLQINGKFESRRPCACSWMNFGLGDTLAKARSDRIRAHRRHAGL